MMKTAGSRRKEALLRCCRSSSNDDDCFVARPVGKMFSLAGGRMVFSSAEAMIATRRAAGLMLLLSPAMAASACSPTEMNRIGTHI